MIWKEIMAQNKRYKPHANKASSELRIDQIETSDSLKQETLKQRLKSHSVSQLNKKRMKKCKKI